MKTNIIILFLALIYISGCSTREVSSMKVLKNTDGILVSEGNQKIFFYQRKAKSLQGKFSRSNYIHPVFNLNGDTLTEDFPDDHPHQRGVYWAWHQLWIGDKRIGDGWVEKDILWDVKKIETVERVPGTMAIKFIVSWKSPNWKNEKGDMIPFLEEQTLVRVYKQTEVSRKIDFEISLLALEENLKIGGSEDKKGYGGFSVRMKMPADLKFTGQNGKVIPKNEQVEAGPWLDFSGSFGSNGMTTGLAIFCHPTNPNFPQPWILRQKGSMQNVVFPGRNTVTLSTQKRMVLRYRLIIHDGSASDINLGELFKEYRNKKVFFN